MATTWARADVILTADGRGLPAQVYKYAKQAGDQGGEVLEKEFDKHLTDMGSYQLNRLRERMRKEGTASGRILGRTVSQAFETQIKARIGKAVDEIAQAFAFEGELEKWAGGFDSVGEATERMRANLQLARDEGRLSAAQWKELNDQWAKALPNLQAIEAEERKLNERIVDNNKTLAKHASLWRRLSANTRQWTLIIGAVTAAMGELSTLGSAAGAGILVLGGAFAGVLTGLGTTVAAFKVFAGDIDDLPSSLRPARNEFDKFTKSFDELGDAIAKAAFEDSADAWKSMTGTVKALTPAFERMGSVIGDLLNDFAAGLKRNERGLEQFIDNSSRIFGSLMRTVGRLGEALLDAFNNPAFQGALDKMNGWIGGLVDSFADFVTSERFTKWIEDSVFILGKFNGLIEAAGKVLSDLVDDRAIELTGQLLDNLTELVEGPLAGLLEIAKELDIFGLLAEGLNKFGRAMEPLAGPMEDLAIAFNDVVQSGIDTIAPIIEDIAEALAPFVQSIADFMKENPKAVADAIMALAIAFQVLSVVKIGKVAADMLLFTTTIGVGGEKIKKFDVGKLKKIGGGIAGLAAVFAVQLIPDSFWDQFDIESNLPQNVLTGAAFGLMFGAWGALIGAGIGLVVSLFQDFEGTFNDIGTNLVATIVGGPMGQVNALLAEWFAGLVPEEWKTSENPMQQAMAMLAEAVQDPGTFLTELPTMFQTMWTNIQASMDAFGQAWDTFWGSIPAMWESMWATLNNPEFWFAIADSLGQWIAGLIDGFTTFLIELAVGWTTFWNSLPTILAVAWLTIMATLQGWWNNIKTGFTSWFTGIIAGWMSFWNSLPKTPAAIGTAIIAAIAGWWNSVTSTFSGAYGSISSGWTGFWTGLIATVRGVVNTIIGIVNRLFGPIGEALGRLGSLFNMGKGAGGGGAADGRMVFGPRRILVGEAGPEAIVPLKRNLSQVDPSVRWLSAIAQGKTTPMAGGGIVGGGRSLTVAPGAIVIQGVRDPNAAAVGVVNRIAERFA